MVSLLRLLLSPWSGTARDLLAALEEAVGSARHPWWRLLLLCAMTLGVWVLYVPVHELLHVLGCVAAGGTVHELEIQSLYGGDLLEKLFPFVRAGGEYAGRLARFDTGGSDLVYLATDLCPFMLTLAGAVPLLRLARRRRSVALLALGAVLACAPLVGLTGDYYEMGSILVSSGLGVVLPAAPRDRIEALRHDDLAALLREFATRFPEGRPAWGTAVAAAAVLGTMLAGATLWLSGILAGLIERRGAPAG